MGPRKGEMEERRAKRVKPGAYTKGEGDDIRAKMADRKAKIQRGERPAKADMGPRKAEMEERLANRVESGEITQAESYDIRSNMADRKAKIQPGERPSKADLGPRKAELEELDRKSSRLNSTH